MLNGRAASSLLAAFFLFLPGFTLTNFAFYVMIIVEAKDMKYYTFEIIIEKEDNGQGYYAYSPTLPGCFSNGPTIEDCRKNIREAIQLHIESLAKRSKEIPQAEKLVHVEEISIGLP
jgi:predicted RNase H-like HicB family nuclease